MLLAAVALARPGGGGSFSGGRGHGGGGGGGDGDFIVSILYLLLRLVFDAPIIGIPLLIVVVIIIVSILRAKVHDAEWSTAASSAEVKLPGVSAMNAAQMQHAIRKTDPEFSIVLFEDFLYALYAEVQHARGKNDLDRLRPYVSEKARAAMRRPDLSAVEDVIVGAVQLASFTMTGEGVRVRVRYEVNYTEVDKAGKKSSWWARETWHLRRPPGVESRPPERIRTFGCPSCGAKLEALRGNVCSHCNQVIDTGAFDWFVDAIATEMKEAKGPLLTADLPEKGTSLPTIVAPDLETALHGLERSDPEFSRKAFVERARMIFDRFQTAWSARDLLQMRPFMSDNLFQQQLYWIEAYKREHLRNITEDARINGVHFARVLSDKRYDAITIRLFATSKDYLVNDGGQLVSGSKDRMRSYGEYWTLIRGASVKGTPRTDQNCPSCGAPLRISMAGQCEYCSAKVTSGDFDWVLSKIEQDEVYAG
jgi:predicted lipid-binding transport protein (Tim44 family)